MLTVSRSVHAQMIAQAIDCYPEEACGLLIGKIDTGDASGSVERFVRCENITHSGKVYTIAPRDLMRADRDAEDQGLEIIGVMHSHTHTDPFPSQTDVNQAPDPSWHYVIVGLKRDEAEVRSYRLVEGTISEERLAVD